MKNIKSQYIQGNTLSSSPILHVIDNFLGDEEIETILKFGKSQVKQALVSSAKSGVQSEGRTGKNTWLAHDYSSVTKQLAESLSSLVKLPIETAESFQIIHYAKGQEYKPHYDAWDSETERGQRCLSKGGQRLLTCLMYLNTPLLGGGTAFPKLNQEVAAIRGRLVIFHNCHPRTVQRHPLSLHGGLPVNKGEKWACNLWFRSETQKTATH